MKMKSYRDRKNEMDYNRHEIIAAIIEPFGFETIHTCQFRHIASRISVDLSASDISPENLMTNIINTVIKVSNLKGQIEVKKSFQKLISSEDAEEQLSWMNQD